MKKLVLMGCLSGGLVLASGRASFAQVGGGAGGALGGGGLGGGGIARDRDTSRVDPALNEANKRRDTSSSSSENGAMLIEASVLINVKADEYVAVFALSQQEKTVAQADARMNATLGAFKAAIAKMGVKESDFFVDFVLQNRVYALKLEPQAATPMVAPSIANSSNPNSSNFNSSGARSSDSPPQRASEELVGFELKKNVSIRFKDKALLDQIASAAAKLEIYDLVKVDYVVNDIAAIQARLQSETARLLKAKIERYNQFGVGGLSAIQVVTDSPSIYYPIVNYASYQAAESNSTNLDPQRITVVRALKTRTFYFNPLDGSGFDTVVNPIIIEPVVQFTSYVKVRARRLS